MSSFDSVNSWKIALSCAFINLILSGCSSTDGLFFVRLLALNDAESRENTSWAFGVSGISMVIFALVTGFLSSRMSARLLFTIGILLTFFGSFICYFSTHLLVIAIFYSFIKGCGRAIVQVTFPFVITGHFKNKIATAMSLAIAGLDGGVIIFPPLVNLILENYDIAGSFLLVSGAFLQALPATIFVKPPFNERKKRLLTEEKKTDDLQIVNLKDESDSPLNEPLNSRHLDDTNKAKSTNTLSLLKVMFSSVGFYIILLTQSISVFIFFTYNLLIVDYLKDKGIPVADGVLMMTVCAGGMIFANLGLGWVTDTKLVTTQFYLFLTGAVTAVTTVSIPLVYSYYGLLVIGFILGISQGARYAVSLVVLRNYLKQEAMALASGVSRAVSAAAFLTCPLLVGIFRDGLGSYDGLFFLMGAFAAFVGVLWLFEQIYYRNRKRCQ